MTDNFWLLSKVCWHFEKAAEGIVAEDESEDISPDITFTED
jgi:hypothetical protein